MESAERNIKVSVCVVAYNQEYYIAECLKGLVNQETNFRYEIIVGDDCSTDGTKEIIASYEKEYPDLIRVIFHENNIGPVSNLLCTYSEAAGKYIAHLDGDDAVLPGKLQAQYDALEDNPQCTICSHDVVLIDNNGLVLSDSYKSHKAGINTLGDLYETLPFFAHSSKMFVNDLGSSYWNEFKSDTIDIEIHVQQAKRGNIFHLNDALGCYRVAVGMSSGNRSVNPMLPNATRRVFNKAILDGDYHIDFIGKCYAQAFFKYAYQSALLGNMSEARDFICESVGVKKISLIQFGFYVLSFFPKFLYVMCGLRRSLK